MDQELEDQHLTETSLPPLTGLPTVRTDVKRLYVVGGVLLAAAATFAWYDLAVAPAYLLAVASLVCGALAILEWPSADVGPVSLAVTATAGGVWFILSQDPRLLWGLAATALAAAAGVVLERDRNDRTLRVSSWYAMAISALVGSASFYFQFLTLGIAADTVSRRLILTLGWLVSGVALVVMGRMRRREPMRHAGYLFLAVSVGKALLYDTTHLEGILRVGVLALAGLGAIIGASLLSKQHEGA
jgi:uncharacterized membrane protein